MQSVMTGLSNVSNGTLEKMSDDRIVVLATWDPECDVWVAVSDDVPGLTVEAESLNALAPALDAIIPQLLEANNVPRKTTGRRLPYHMVAHIDREIEISNAA